MQTNRLKYLQNILHEKKLDSILISNFHNIMYLSEFKTLSPSEREAFLFVTQTNSYLLTDARYYGQITNKNLIPKLLTYEKNLLKHLDEISKDEKIISIGFEIEDLKYMEYEQIQKNLNYLVLKPLDRFVIQQRAIKEIVELKKIKKACELTSRCLEEIIPLIKKETTEKEIAWKLEQWIRTKGYELAFDPIVAIDANSAIPHYNTKMGSSKVRDMSIILIDFGLKYEDYVSDITRMFFFNGASNEVQNIYKNLLQIQQAATDQILVESECKNVDYFVREKLKKHNLPPMPHSTGHGIGLEIHEYPKVSYVSQDIFQNGQVFTIEPGVYYSGKFGMRIEDTVSLVHEKREVFTHYKKDLTILS